MSDLNELVTAEVEKRLCDPVSLQEILLRTLNQNTRLLEDKKRLTETIQEKEQEIEVLAPVKEFYDRVTESDDWMEMATVAKLLNFKGYGRNNILEFLRNRGVLRYNNEPYQKYVDLGYFKIVEKSFPLPYGETGISRKTVVSQKGMDFIRKLIEAEIAA